MAKTKIPNGDIKIAVDEETGNTTALVPTVMPMDLREMVTEVFVDLGGKEAMMAWVNESTINRRIFYKDIFPRLIPKEVNSKISGTDGGPVRMVIEWDAPPQPMPAELPAGSLLSIVNAIASGDDND